MPQILGSCKEVRYWMVYDLSLHHCCTSVRFGSCKVVFFPNVICFIPFHHYRLQYQMRIIWLFMVGPAKSEDIKKRCEEVSCGFFRSSSNNSSPSRAFINHWGRSCHCSYSWDYSWDPQKSRILSVLGQNLIKKWNYREAWDAFLWCCCFEGEVVWNLKFYFQCLVLESWPFIRALIKTYLHAIFCEVRLVELVE